MTEKKLSVFDRASAALSPPYSGIRDVIRPVLR